MSVQAQLERLQAAKDRLKQAIDGKGVSVPGSALLQEYGPLVQQIKAIESVQLSLLASGWQGSGPYTQTVLASKVTEDWIISVPVSAPGAVTNIEQIGEALGYISSAKTTAGRVTFTCNEYKPGIDLSIVVNRIS